MDPPQKNKQTPKQKHTHLHTCIKINICSHRMRVRLVTITQVECQKAVHWGGGEAKLAWGMD